MAGTELTAELSRQVEGRSLVPLLNNPQAAWPDRLLFTHLGRWPKLADPNESKYRMAAVRDSRWSLVSPNGGSTPSWQLFDLSVDYGQQTNLIAQHPEVAERLATAFNQWWQESLPMLVNERVIGPELNPFAVRYWRQFGGGPTEDDYRRMDPTAPWPPPPSGPAR